MCSYEIVTCNDKWEIRSIFASKKKKLFWFFHQPRNSSKTRNAFSSFQLTPFQVQLEISCFNSFRNVMNFICHDIRLSFYLNRKKFFRFRINKQAIKHLTTYMPYFCKQIRSRKVFNFIFYFFIYLRINLPFLNPSADDEVIPKL